MRYQTWGISRIRLLAFAFFPAFAWAAFRVQSMPELSLNAIFLYYRTTIWVWGGVLASVSFVWIFYFRRGWFRARQAAYFFLGLELFFELYQSVEARQLIHLTLALVYFGVSLALYRWLEGWVELAAYNPKLFWYEGTPKVIPHLDVQIRGEAEPTAWVQASVRRLDEKGLFILLDEPVVDSPDFRVRGRIEFRLRWKQKEVMGEGLVVGRLLDHAASQQVAGMGLLFLPKGLYPFIQYTALYEALRGEGYAF